MRSNRTSGSDLPIAMPRLLPSSLLRASRQAQGGSFVSGNRLFASTPAKDSGAQNSRPGWEGRHGDDHVVNRQNKDVQTESSHQAMNDHQDLKEGSQAISRKDEGDNNKRAKEDHPEAPEPVIGMNSERGSVR